MEMQSAVYSRNAALDRPCGYTYLIQKGVFLKSLNVLGHDTNLASIKGASLTIHPSTVPHKAITRTETKLLWCEYISSPDAATISSAEIHVLLQDLYFTHICLLSSPSTVKLQQVGAKLHAPLEETYQIHSNKLQSEIHLFISKVLSGRNISNDRYDFSIFSKMLARLEICVVDK